MFFHFITENTTEKARYHEAVYEINHFVLFRKNTSSCIVLHCLAWSCIVLHRLACLALTCIILHCLASSCIILHCPAFSYTTLQHLTLSYIILHRLALSCIVLHHLALPRILLHHLAASCIVLHYLASSCGVLHHLASFCIILRTETPINTTNVNSFFVWKLRHKWPKKSSVPWCYEWHMLFHVCMEPTTKMAQKDQYRETVNHTCDNTSLLICLHTFAHKKNVQYHNAVNGTHCLIFFWKESTETIKKGSVPWCPAWHIWFHFCVENHT